MDIEELYAEEARLEGELKKVRALIQADLDRLSARREAAHRAKKESGK